MRYIITMLMILHVIGVGAFTINNGKILNRYVSKGWAVSIRGATSISGNPYGSFTNNKSNNNPKKSIIANETVRRLATSTGVGDSSSISSITTKSSVKSKISESYVTLTSTKMCGANLVIVQSPTPEQFNFDDKSLVGHQFTIQNDHILTEEIEFGKIKEQGNKARLNKFVGGRVALRRALMSLDIKPNIVPAIMKDNWGAPVLPMDITGSISHKDYIAVGIASIDSRGRIGVDLEHTTNKAAAMLQRRILTAAEQERIGRIPGVSALEETLLRFSFKESIYKSIHSFLPRPIDFSEVEVDPLPDGSAKINFCLKTGENFDYLASWQRYKEKYWLTCAYLIDPTDSIRKYR